MHTTRLDRAMLLLKKAGVTTGAFCRHANHLELLAKGWLLIPPCADCLRWWGDAGRIPDGTHPSNIEAFTVAELELLGREGYHPIGWHVYWDGVTPREKCCGYCGSPEESVTDDFGSWPSCPDCGGV